MNGVAAAREVQAARCMSGQDGKFEILLDRIANAFGQSGSIQPEDRETTSEGDPHISTTPLRINEC